MIQARELTMNIKQNKGFTLIEVLIAVLVLGIGALGLAAMQAASMRNNHQAYLRSQATLLAHEIIDRMRANMVGISAYDNNTAEQIDSCASKEGCTPEQMAKNDVWEWQQAVSAIFPGCGSQVCSIVCIDRTSDDGSPDAPQCQNDFAVSEDDIYAVKIWWNDVVEENATQRFVIAVQP
jgi:type IV pilus assembly protein PilV